MREIAVAFKSEDTDLKKVLVNQFGKDVLFLDRKGFDGIEMVCVAIIPIAALTFQVTDFFMTHFSKDKSKKRVLIDKDQNISIEGYPIEEVESILKSLLETTNNDR